MYVFTAYLYILVVTLIVCCPRDNGPRNILGWPLYFCPLFVAKIIMDCIESMEWNTGMGNLKGQCTSIV